MRFSGVKLAMVGALALCAAMGTKPAFAASHFDVGVGINFSRPVYTAPVYVAPSYCDGHYETRAQSVLVEPGRCERRWVEPVYETRYYNGVPQTFCVRQGGWQDYCTPARYETRYVQVWVPGCAPRYYAPNYYTTPSYSSSYIDFNYRSRR